jgi:hypothetical protein
MLISHELKMKRHKRHSDRNPKQTQGFQRDASFSPMMSLPSYFPSHSDHEGRCHDDGPERVGR